MKTLLIYFDPYGKCFMVIKPSFEFNGDYKTLVEAITGGHYSYFKTV